MKGFEKMLTISAIIAVHNGVKTIEPVLEHLRSNAIDVYIIDNGSTDGTRTIIKKYSDSTVKSIIDQPFDGVFHLKEQLLLKEKLMRDIDSGWVIHLDADEILESPRDGETLRGMIERAEREGYDIIDCDEFVFVPMQPDGEEVKDYIKNIRYYYYFKPVNRSLQRAFQLGTNIDNWIRSGGHRVLYENKKTAKEKMRLRHYIAVSFDHLRGQYLSRVFDGEELLNHWHDTRTRVTPESLVRPRISALNDVDRDGFVTSRPYTYHLIYEKSLYSKYLKKFKKGLHLLLHEPKSFFLKLIRRNKKHTMVIHDVTNVTKAISDDSQIYKPMPFIVGCGRSGTTLLRLLLDAHPDMAIPTETMWLLDVIEVMQKKPANLSALKKHITRSPYWPDMGVSKKELYDIFSQHSAMNPGETLRRIYGTYALKHGASRYGEKTLMNSVKMCEIAAVLPEAHFIHIIRDGRDVALSLREVWFGSDQIRDLACFWVNRIRVIRQQAEFLPHYLEIFYEDLVQNPEKELRKIAEFIDLKFSSIQLKAHEHADERLSESKEKIVHGKKITNEMYKNIFKLTLSPPNTSRIGRWKAEMTMQEISAFERIAGDMLTDLGYERAT